MREFKLRYTYKRKDDGKLYQEIVPIQCLEGKGDRPFVRDSYEYWDIIGRDLYTGLKDKNDKEIYEGDIIQINFLLFKKSKPIWKVVFRDANFMLQNIREHIFVGLNATPSSGEIIGNIYENPELLEVK